MYHQVASEQFQEIITAHLANLPFFLSFIFCSRIYSIAFLIWDKDLNFFSNYLKSLYLKKNFSDFIVMCCHQLMHCWNSTQFYDSRMYIRWWNILEMPSRTLSTCVCVCMYACIYVYTYTWQAIALYRFQSWLMIRSLINLPSRRYNFHLFPRDELNIGMPSYSFSCQTSCLTSMAREGFDFNICIYDGEPQYGWCWWYFLGAVFL